MANIGEIIKEVEVIPLEAPVESPGVDRPESQPVPQQPATPDRELVPAGS